MSEDNKWSTISVKPDVKERFNEQKPEDMNAGEFIAKLLDGVNVIGPEDVGEVVVSLDKLEEEVERMSEELRTVPGRTADELEGRFR